MYACDGGNPHGKFGDYDLLQRVQYAITKGATAVIFINSDTSAENPKTDFTRKFTSVSIPVIFVKGNAAKILKDSVVTNCTVGVDIKKIQKTGHHLE